MSKVRQDMWVSVMGSPNTVPRTAGLKLSKIAGGFRRAQTAAVQLLHHPGDQRDMHCDIEAGWRASGGHCVDDPGDWERGIVLTALKISSKPFGVFFIIAFYIRTVK